MLDTIMLMGIGFLAAGIVMAMVAPLIHERAVRLTTQRNLEATPMSVVEMKAQTDHLRADFAMKTCRLEMSVTEMQGKVAEAHRETGRKAAEIAELKTQLHKANIAVLRLQEHELLRKSTTRRIVTLVVYLFERFNRRNEEQPAAPMFSALYALVAPAKAGAR